MKILVVDDDKEIAQLLEIYIKNEGYEPLTAYNGKEALTKLHTTPDIALMILDIMMPEMSGIEVMKVFINRLLSMIQQPMRKFRHCAMRVKRLKIIACQKTPLYTSHLNLVPCVLVH